MVYASSLVISDFLLQPTIIVSKSDKVIMNEMVFFIGINLL